MKWFLLIFTFNVYASELIDITEHYPIELADELIGNELAVGDIDYGVCFTSNATSSSKRRWPGAQHVKFCLDTAPKLYKTMLDNTSWNSEAIKLSISWTLAEAGWFHSLNKPKNYCFWGFMKNEQTLSCSAKTMEDGFNIWKNYLSDSHNPPNYYVKYRAKSCAPHRTLIKNFEKKDVEQMWSDDDLNLWMRSIPHVGKKPAYYNARNPGEIKTNPKNGKAQTGDGSCTYNSINDNYAGHIKSSLRTMKRYCNQVYQDIITDDPNGVHRYLYKKDGFDKVKHLLNYKTVKQNYEFYELINQ